MEIISNKYYIGFEGEPEIQFIYKKACNTYKTIIWEGYFDEIMTKLVPEEEGWTGLAYYYNMYLGWYEESPWIIDDLQMAIKQLNTIQYEALSDEASEILKMLCNIINDAIDNGLNVSIAIE